MKPKSDGAAGSALIRFTGFATSRPAVVIEYENANGAQREVRRNIPRVEMNRPKALTAHVRAGEPGLTRLELRVKVDTQQNERAELSERTRSEQVDERILSAEQVVAMVEHLSALRAAGLYEDALAYHALETLAVRAGWEHKIDWENEPVVELAANGSPAPFPDIRRFPEATAMLKAWLRERGGEPQDILFPSIRGRSLSRDAVERLVAKHTATAQGHCPALKRKKVTPHVLRHTAAMDLLRHGVDRSVIALWLGHESVDTTQMYLHADMHLKEQAMSKTTPFGIKPRRYRPSDRLLTFLESL